MKKYLTAIVLIIIVMLFRSPLYSVAYRAMHGDEVTFSKYRFKMPQWYAPMHSEEGVYLAAGNSIPKHACLIGITEPAKGMEDYEKTRQFVQDSTRAVSVTNERAIHTATGLARCFEVVLTGGRVEGTCRWEAEPLLLTYVGPANDKDALYEMAHTAQKLTPR